MTDDTRKPVSALSGRELDAAVAEEVMEWEYVGRSGTYSGREYRRDTSNVVGPAPHYSTDIAAAWEVFAEVDDLRLVEKLSDGSFLVGDYGYDRIALTRSRADTAPEAVCRAALKAARSED